MNRKPGDWNCPSCDHMNFGWRDACQRCSEPKPGEDDRDRGDYGRSYGGGGDYGRSYGGDYGSRGYGGSYGSSDVRPGDWYCSDNSCGAHNFASRNNCFKCGAAKDEDRRGGRRGRDYDSGGRGSRGGYGSGEGGGRAGWKSGDWICTRSGCNEHNFASRVECFRCQAPREST